MGGPRRRLVGEGAELCSKCGEQVARGSGRQCHWCYLWHHVGCLVPCALGECGYLFREQRGPLHTRPKKRVAAR
eukprot:12772706-Alexandrium_andersonii.AAC.1